jgi:hypothetical protein
MQALLDQKYGTHKCADLMPYFYEYLDSGYFFSDKQTPFANCAANADLGLSFKHISNTHQAYRMYINERWKRDTIPLSWVWGKQPDWRER